MPIPNTRIPLTAVFLALVAALATAAYAQSTREAGSNSLYQRHGGLVPISVVVSDFIDTVVADPEIRQ